MPIARLARASALTVAVQWAFIGNSGAQPAPSPAEQPPRETPAPTPAPATPSKLIPPVHERFQEDLAWSLDGSYLAFSEYTPLSPGAPLDPMRWSVKVVPADGSIAPRTLADNARSVSWTMAGDSVVFCAPVPGAASNFEIFSGTFDGRRRYRLTRNPANDTQPACSPRGELIAFVSDRDAGPAGGHSIYVMKDDGSEVRRLTTGPGKDHSPAWSPDGSILVFVREAEGRPAQVCTIGADGSGESRITNDDASNAFPSFIPLAGRRGPDTHFSILMACRPPGEPSRLVVLSRSGPPTPGDVVRTDTLRDIPVRFARSAPEARGLAIIVGEWPRSAIYLADPRDPPRFRKLVN